MGIWALLSRLFQAGFKTTAVLCANIAISFRGRDSRRFSVDKQGRWVNRQRRATFVSPTLHAARYDVVKRTILGNWCHTYTPKPGDVVFDIGAGIGAEAVIFSHLVGPRGHVYSVEAHPDTAACLQKTVELSDLANVSALPVAIMDKDGETSISSGDSHIANSVMVGGDIAVPARSVASLCAELGLKRIDFLKMNIESAERLAVQGFGDVEISHLAISCHDFIADQGFADSFRTKDFVRQFLKTAGYMVTERDGPTPWMRDALFADRV